MNTVNALIFLREEHNVCKRTLGMCFLNELFTDSIFLLCFCPGMMLLKLSKCDNPIVNWKDYSDTAVEKSTN
jgi:hypothetical protein